MILINLQFIENLNQRNMACRMKKKQKIIGSLWIMRNKGFRPRFSGKPKAFFSLLFLSLELQDDAGH